MLCRYSTEYTILSKVKYRVHNIEYSCKVDNIEYRYIVHNIEYSYRVRNIKYRYSTEYTI